MLLINIATYDAQCKQDEEAWENGFAWISESLSHFLMIMSRLKLKSKLSHFFFENFITLNHHSHGDQL
jgi:hypothetical protein